MDDNDDDYESELKFLMFVIGNISGIILTIFF